MQPQTIRDLIAINRRFYQHFAVEFDRTRARPQPGVESVLEKILPAKDILDLGMGNGALWRRLNEKGFEGTYVGIDFSPALAQIAASLAGGSDRAEFMVRDLSAQGWDAGLEGPCDRILAFAVFHHLPEPTVRAVLGRCRDLIASDGLLFLSCWQFLRSERMRTRIQPWDRVGIHREDLDAEDYLLDWRRGGEGLRYVRFYSADALDALAAGTGFRVRDSFYSDGREGDLGLYQVWEPVDA